MFHFSYFTYRLPKTNLTLFLYTHSIIPHFIFILYEQQCPFFVLLSIKTCIKRLMTKHFQTVLEMQHQQRTVNTKHRKHKVTEKSATKHTYLHESFDSNIKFEKVFNKNILLQI